jgi:hypothetical protein
MTNTVLKIVTRPKNLHLKTPHQLKEMARKDRNRVAVTEELFRRLAWYRRHVSFPYTAEADRDFRQVVCDYKSLLADNGSVELLMLHPGVYAITSSAIAAPDPIDQLDQRVEAMMISRSQRSARLAREEHRRVELKRHQAKQASLARRLGV